MTQNKQIYNILVEYHDHSYERLEIETNDIDWYMDQYIRNRRILNWKIVKKDGKK